MFVKICGITNPEDALAAVEMGAKSLGFIFVESSPRHVTPEHLKDWIGSIPAHIWKVGVFVDTPAARIEQITTGLGLDVVQLHGAETPSVHPKLPRIWKAFRITSEFQIPWEYPAEALLLDGPGGGKQFDWSKAAGATKQFLLAGGLDETNVAEAVRQVRPWGVDVASGVEAAPGRKNHARMKKFIEAALSQ